MSRRMTTTLVSLCGGMLLWAGSASAGTCQQVEYAELKDMSTVALRQIACHNIIMAGRLGAAALEAEKGRSSSVAAQLHKEAEDCLHRGEDALNVFRDRGHSALWDMCNFDLEPPKEGQR